MVTPLIGGIGWQEILLVAAVIFILFGASRIPMAFRSLGEGLRSFKDGLAGSGEDSKPSGKGESQDAGEPAGRDEEEGRASVNKQS